jgi:hypothetical protein
MVHGTLFALASRIFISAFIRVIRRLPSDLMMGSYHVFRIEYVIVVAMESVENT